MFDECTEGLGGGRIKEIRELGCAGRPWLIYGDDVEQNGPHAVVESTTGERTMAKRRGIIAEIVDDLQEDICRETRLPGMGNEAGYTASR